MIKHKTGIEETEETGQTEQAEVDAGRDIVPEKAEAMIKETLEMLRDKPVASTLTEHFFLADEAWELFKDLPQPLQHGYGLQYILSRASLPLREHDLLLGRFIDKVPDEKEEARFWEIWRERSPATNPVIMYNGGHITLDWRNILLLGIDGYIEKAQANLERQKMSGADEKTLQFLEGMVLTYRAHQTYIIRYGQAAEKAGMTELSRICASISSRPPQTFRESLQLMLFILTVYYVHAGGHCPTLTYGRMDDLLLDYYRADLSEGRLTRETAGYLIDDFNCKANFVLGRGEHQMNNPAFGGNDTGWQRNNCYDAPTYVFIGGYSNRHDHQNNPLTELFAERIHPRFENPVYIYRYTKDRPDEVWNVICDKMRQNASVIVYNDEVVIPAMTHAGISEADATDYTMHACNEPDVPSYAVVGVVDGFLPGMVMDALLLSEGEQKRDYPSIDDLYRRIGDDFRQKVKERFAAYRGFYRAAETPPPQTLSCTDCFTDGTIERARNIGGGGVKYPIVVFWARSIGSATDMLTAIDEVAYKNKDCTLSELIQVLRADFTGFDNIKNRCVKAPKYGAGDNRADHHAAKLMNLLLDVIDEEAVNESGEKDVICFSSIISGMWVIYTGRSPVATPDGRPAGSPPSVNMNPVPGYGRGVTALLDSAAKLPLDRTASGVLNLRLRPDMVKGEEGLGRLKVLIETYFELGGIQLQISVADVAELREAQEHPEDYRDLMVRITGYSAVFTDMSRNGQDEIIRIEEQ